MKQGMSDAQLYPLNLCPDKDEVDTLICIAKDLVQGDLIPCMLNKNIYEILDQTRV